MVSLQERVYNLVQREGIDVSLISKGSKSFDPSTGDMTSFDVSNSVKVSPPQPYDERHIDGTTIKRGDQSVVLPTFGLTAIPEIGDVVIVDGETFKITYIRKLRRRDVVLGYEIQLRR